MIFLPGTDRQFKYFAENTAFEGKQILIAGSGTESFALELINLGAAEVQIITDSPDEIINMRVRVRGSNLKIKLMDYKSTDFSGGRFDFIYSQGSFSIPARRKIYKEMLRILNQDSIICTGEIIRSQPEVPQFMSNIWETSELAPLLPDEQDRFFSSIGLQVVSMEDLSFTLKEFYLIGRSRLAEFAREGPEDEKKYYKKLMSKISHESNAYLDLGGDRFMKFYVYIIKRIN